MEAALLPGIQLSFDDADAADWARGTQLSGFAANEDIGGFDIAPVFVFHGSLAGEERHGSDICVMQDKTECIQNSN